MFFLFLIFSSDLFFHKTHLFLLFLQSLYLYHMDLCRNIQFPRLTYMPHILTFLYSEPIIGLEVILLAQKLLVEDYIKEGHPYFIDFFIEHREKNLHSHEFWELSYVYEGRGTHYLANGKSEPIKEGDFLLISPGSSHCITSPPASEGSWVRVCNFLLTQEYIDNLKKRLLTLRELDEYSLRNAVKDNTSFCIHLTDDSGSINRLMMTAAHEYKHFSDGSAEIIENTALNLFIYITRLYERMLRNENVSTTKNEVIDDLLKYINSNFGSNITLDYLAAYAHLSPAYLSRYFKKCTGMKLSDYIIHTRIEKAKYMLRTNNYSINDICLYCGYRSIGNFQKAFKKATGMTAGEYRQRNK